MCMDFFLFLQQNVVSQITVCGAFSPVYASLHETEREEVCDYILVCRVCVAVLSVLIHFLLIVLYVCI